MKALEKSRARRYESAGDLARDVRRHLDGDAVEACPPSVGYQLRKFVRRHKGRVIAASLVLLALVAGMIGTTWGYLLAERARREAVAANGRAQRRLEQVEKGINLLAGIFADLNLRTVKAEGKPLEVVLADRLVARPKAWWASPWAISSRSRDCRTSWGDRCSTWASLRGRS